MEISTLSSRRGTVATSVRGCALSSNSCIGMVPTRMAPLKASKACKWVLSYFSRPKDPTRPNWWPNTKQYITPQPLHTLHCYGIGVHGWQACRRVTSVCSRQIADFTTYAAALDTLSQHPRACRHTIYLVRTGLFGDLH